MDDSRRRVIGITALLLLVITLSVVGVWRVRNASRLGWAGMTYVPSTTRPQRTQAPPGFSPGMILMVYPGSPADHAGLLRGDTIVAINGLPATDIKRMNALAKRIHSGDRVTYTIKRENRTLSIAVPFEAPTHSPAIATIVITSIAVALTFLTIGLFVFLRKPGDSRTRVFFAMTLVAAASFVMGSLMQIDTPNVRGIAVEPTIASLGGQMTGAATAVFFAPLLLHLALVFPVERPVMRRRRKTVLQWIYGTPVYICICIAVFLIAFGILSNTQVQQEKAVLRIIGVTIVGTLIVLLAVALIRLDLRVRRLGYREAMIRSPFSIMTIALAFVGVAVGVSTWISVKVHSPTMVIGSTIVGLFLVIGLFMAYPIATIISLFRSYRESGVEERRQVKWPLWGTMVAVGGRILLLTFSLGVGFAMAFGVNFTVSPLTLAVPDLLAKALYTLIPLSFAFAILKYRLMNIDVIIRRTVLYTILTGTIFVLYAIVVASLGTALVKFGGVKSQTMLIASTVVIALVTVPLRNQLQQLVDRNLFRERRDYALALRNLSIAIGTSNTVDAFLRYASEQIQQALQNRLVLIALRRDREFVASAKVGVSDDILGSLRVPVDAVAFNTAAIPESLRKLGTTLIVPISAQREPAGLLALGSRLSDEEFSPSDMEFIIAAAGQLAVGTENVRLRDEEADFEQARAMQQILLPKTIPQLPGFDITGLWQPARSVGGDYFDVLRLGDDRVGICIADVAGKGMPAALLMANLQAAVKGSASRDAAPADVCERVKTIVSGNLAGGKFISLFYGVLDAGTRTLTYCNAGHNPPILVRRGANVERLMSGGPAICRLFQDAPHEQAAVELQSGDRLILFTDGVSEARRGEDEFGEDRLIEIVLEHRGLTAREMEKRILSHLLDYTAGDFNDDVTMIVVAAG